MDSFRFVGPGRRSVAAPRRRGRLGASTVGHVTPRLGTPAQCDRIVIAGFSQGGRFAIERAAAAPRGCHVRAVGILSGGSMNQLQFPGFSEGQTKWSLSVRRAIFDAAALLLRLGADRRVLERRRRAQSPSRSESNSMLENCRRTPIGVLSEPLKGPNRPFGRSRHARDEGHGRADGRRESRAPLSRRAGCEGDLRAFRRGAHRPSHRSKRALGARPCTELTERREALLDERIGAILWRRTCNSLRSYGLSSRLLLDSSTSWEFHV